MIPRYCSSTLLALAFISLLFASPTTAQTASALLLEGDPVPGTPTETITALNNTAVNHNNGYAAGLSASDGISRFWGSGTGGAPSLLRSEGTFPPYEQTGFESFFGLGTYGELAYSPSSTNLNTMTTGLDGVWIDDTVIAIEEDLSSVPGFWWSFGSRPTITATGEPWWVGGITDTQGGITDSRGLFRGAGGAPVLIGGDVVPNLPMPLSNANTVSFDFRVSMMGTNYVAEVQMPTSSSVDNAVVKNGVGVISGGVLMQEGNVIPASVGGQNGEAWDNFDFAGVNESGRWMLTGDTNGDTATDEFLSVNGIIEIREGDVLDGETLTGSIEGAYMNENGDIAFIWDIVDGTSSLEALYLNDQLLLREGDAVDIDGDMMADLATITNFTGISSLTISDRRMGDLVDIYFTADVDVVLTAAPVVSEERYPEDLAALEQLGLSWEDVKDAEPGKQVVVEGYFRLTAGSGAVPVLAGPLQADLDGTGVRLRWEGYALDGVEGFQLSRRVDNGPWAVLHAGNLPPRLGEQQHLDSMQGVPGGVWVEYRLTATLSSGEQLELSEPVRLKYAPSLALALSPNRPNPFNPRTTLQFSVKQPGPVRLTVHDLRGAEVAVLHDTWTEPGALQVDWDGRDALGRAVSSGVYVVRLMTDHGQRSRKITLLK